MDDEDGRCLLDVICDPQALNDFLHGSEKIANDDLLDSTGDVAGAFFAGTGLHVQEPSGNHLNSEQNQPSASVDLDFLEDEILGSPSVGGANLSNSDQPCDILQQSLQEANITEQTLEAEAELDLGSFQLPTIQPVVQATPDAAAQIFSGGADLIGLQQPAVLTQQTLMQQPVGAEVVNKTISVPNFIQPVGLGNVTLQQLSNLQALPNGSPSGTLGIGQIQVVGQHVMAINQTTQQLIAKQVQSTQVTTLPVGSYVTQPGADQQQMTLSSAGVSPQSAGLVIPKNLSTATTTLNGNSMFPSVSATQGTQSLAVASSLSSPLMHAQNVIIQRTPTPIQPKPSGVIQSKLFQISPKPYSPSSNTLTIQSEAGLQQQKAQHNMTFVAGKPGQNVVVSGFPPNIPANMFKQPQQQHALAKPMSVHLLNQGGSIVIPAQQVPQAMLQGQNQFVLSGQLAGPSAVQIPQQLSALQANVGGQILTAAHPSGQAHIITSQGHGGQLITNPSLPAQILANQNIAGQLNLGAHILSGSIQLQPNQVGQHTLFPMPVSLAGSLATQTHPQVSASLASSTISQTGQTVIQGVTLPSQVAMLNAAVESASHAVSIQATATTNTQNSSIVQHPLGPGANLLSSASDQPSILTVQTTSQAQASSQPQLSAQQQQQAATQISSSSQPSPSLAPSPDKMAALNQPVTGTVLSPEAVHMFFQQKEQNQQQQHHYHAAPTLKQEMNLSQPLCLQSLPPPSYSAASTTTSSVPASVIVSSAMGPALQPPVSRELTPNLATVESKCPTLLPQFPSSQSQPAQGCQIQHSIILQAKHQASVSQAPTTLNQFNNHSSSMLVSSQGQPVTVAMPAQPQTHMNAPVPLPSQPPVSTAPGPSEITPVHGKSQGQGGQPAQLAALLQQTSVLVKTSAAATPTPLPVDSKAFSGATPPLQGKAIPGQVKPGTQLPIQQPIQAKTGVISSVLSLSLPKGPLQIQVVEKGLSQLLPAVPVQTQQQFDTKVGNLVKKPPAIHPSKEARLLEHLRRHQGAVLQPDHRTPFRSFQDALHRLLPYHVYQGTLPSDQDNRKVDEDFEEVSTQLLKRTQAMLNKYRLLLLEESRRMSPSAEMVMIDRMFIQEEKTALSLDKKLAKEKPDEYVASTSRAQSLPSSSSSVSPSASGVGHTPEGLRSPSLQTSAQIHPTKLVIKHSGEGSPSVMWAKASPSLDDDEETLPSRSKPPMKTYEARSRIGLKLKIKQEAGLSKVVHNTALDPIHQTAGASSVIKTPDRPVGAIPPATPCQMNGTTDHMTLTPAEKKPMATYCRLPLRKTYRENVDAFVMDKTPENRMAGEGGKLESPQVPVVVKQEDGSKSMTASHRTEESPRPVTRKEKSEERSRTALLNRSGDALRPLPLDKPASKTDDPAGGLIKDLAEVEEDFYHGIVKSEPPDSLGPELSWEVLPPAKRKKSESFDVDNASFSSDSPQDDSLNEHLQSAIDSILNLQQPQAAGGAAGVNTRTPASSYNSSSSPFSSPVHRTENYLTPNHNGGLGTRTYNR
nr:PREDICTED: glioma tumor suppressor candidate region gene 1 protein isoform X4 [Latimeria chalumnae]|eukprot:XP_014348805.1 PREDICTED: glioma tumor suppressor candidate region gene 1 protein isoform X4 [Latimeria chalumnae]